MIDPTSGEVPAPTATVLLRGNVVDGDARPIAGATVAAHAELGDGFNLLSEIRQIEECATATTGPDGRFALPVPFARVLTLRASAHGFATRRIASCYGGEEHTIVLMDGATLVGRVTDAATGDPVADVVIDGRYRGGSKDRFEVRTAADGSYRLTELPPGRAVFDATPQAHEVKLRTEVELVAGRTTQCDIALDRGGAVSGRVTDTATGLPIANAEISAGWTFEKVVRTDAAGNYRMIGAPGPGVPHMHARAAGYAADMHEVSGRGEQRIDFALARAGAVRGRIVDGAGLPVANVYVAADADLGTRNGIGRTDWQSVWTDADGMFRIERLAPGADYALFVRHRGAATLVYMLPGRVDPDRVFEVGDIRLVEPAVLLGRIVDQNGAGVAGASVDLDGTNDDVGTMLGAAGVAARRVPYHARSRDATTDRDGWYRFADLAGGTYTLRVAVRGGPDEEFEGVVVAPSRTTTAADFVLDLGLSIRGVVELEGGERADAVSLSVQIDGLTGDDPVQRWVSVGADGTFGVVGLPEGRYRVTALTSGWANDEPPPWLNAVEEDVAAGRDDVRLVLPRASFITGRVLDAAGQPQRRVGVFAFVPDTAGIEARALSGDDGSFRLRVPRDTVWDLRFGALPDGTPLALAQLDPATSRLHRGVRAGTVGVELAYD